MSNEANFSMNFKIGTEYGPTQVTVRGDSIDEFSTHHAELLAYLGDIVTEVKVAPTTQAKATTSEGEQAIYDIDTDTFLEIAKTQSAKKPYLKVHIGPWMKFGAPFYSENIKALPEMDGWEEWDYGDGLGIPKAFTQVVIALKPEGTPRKVVALR